MEGQQFGHRPDVVGEAGGHGGRTGLSLRLGEGIMRRTEVVHGPNQIHPQMQHALAANAVAGAPHQAGQTGAEGGIEPLDVRGVQGPAPLRHLQQLHQVLQTANHLHHTPPFVGLDHLADDHIGPGHQALAPLIPGDKGYVEKDGYGSIKSIGSPEAQSRGDTGRFISDTAVDRDHPQVRQVKQGFHGPFAQRCISWASGNGPAHLRQQDDRAISSVPSRIRASSQERLSSWWTSWGTRALTQTLASTTMVRVPAVVHELHSWQTRAPATCVQFPLPACPGCAMLSLFVLLPRVGMARQPVSGRPRRGPGK